MYHTATLLPDGNLLLAGGVRGPFFPPGPTYAVDNSAVLYDTHVQIPVESYPMIAKREHHTATLRVDGKVLITGGDDGTTATGTAEVFDPPVGAFTAFASSVSARTHATATLDPDGRVVVIGGGNGTSTLADAQLFDEGRHAQPAATPVIETFKVLGQDLAVEGFFPFRQETTDGGSNTSAENYPLLVLQREDSEEALFQPSLGYLPHFTKTNPISVDLVQQSTSPIQGGWHWVRLIENGIPSVAKPYLTK